MAVETNVMDFQQLYESIQAAGTWDTIQEAVNSGVVHSTQSVNGAAYQAVFQSVEGGAGTPITSFDSALELARQGQVVHGATLARIVLGTAALAKASTEAVKYTLVGACTLPLPTVASACAPLAGVALGNELYKENPNLWTKISTTLMPYCYAENKIQAYLEFQFDPVTGFGNPIACIATSIIDSLRDLFQKEEVHPTEIKRYESEAGVISGTSFPSEYPFPNHPDYPFYRTDSNNAFGFIVHDGNNYFGYSDADVSYRSDYYGGTYSGKGRGFSILSTNPDDWYDFWNYMPIVEMAIATAREIISEGDAETEDPTPGVEVPTIDPSEVPGLTPDNPIIIGPDGEPIEIEVTPIYVPIIVIPETPEVPETVPDPETKPESWPEEEPWPTTIPFPLPDPVPSTDPTPNPEEWPEVMPWPLPSEPPSEWPTIPEDWPGEYPEEIPWPNDPSQWPEEVPWPETPPSEWPETEPWPETPEEWPEEIPWPTPWPENWPTYPPSWPEEFPKEIPWPAAPEDWPEEVPWPNTPPEWWPEGEPWPDSPDQWPEPIPWPIPPVWPIPWPKELPYPWSPTYPIPSPNPYPDPQQLPDPQKQVDPYIDPWPYPWPYPYPDPKPSSPPFTPTPADPYRDPSQPQPKPDPTPSPVDPADPYPTPPTGTPTPPIPPIIPLPFSSTTGLISVYHPTQSELLSFAHWLWVTWQDATIDKIWNNPFDGVITLFELYCTPTDVGRKNIRSGFLDSGVSSETISRYTSIDCGSIFVPEYYGNYFDYAPYSKCHIYLPFIGIVELNVDDIVGHGVNVTYRIDEYNGSCIAMITCAKSTMVNGEEVDYSSVIYQFSGNCAVELPLAGGSQASIKAGLLEAAAWGLGSVISGVITGGMEGGLGIGASIGNNLAQGAASAVHSVVSAKSSVQHSGSFGSSYGAMGAKIPYLIVTRPKQIQVPDYNSLYGYQAHKMVKIGDCEGYIRCREVHVISPTASDEEKAQIEQLLKMGVYVTE